MAIRIYQLCVLCAVFFFVHFVPAVFAPQRTQSISQRTQSFERAEVSR